MLDRYPALTSNAAGKAFDRTSGGATSADSVVARSKRSQATAFSLAPSPQTKVATRQLRKEGGQTLLDLKFHQEGEVIADINLSGGVA
jgi:hypothetical protein